MSLPLPKKSGRDRLQCKGDRYDKQRQIEARTYNNNAGRGDIKQNSYLRLGSGIAAILLVPDLAPPPNANELTSNFLPPPLFDGSLAAGLGAVADDEVDARLRQGRWSVQLEILRASGFKLTSWERCRSRDSDRVGSDSKPMRWQRSSG